MPPIASAPVTIPQDVTQFCATHDTTADLQLAIHLADEIFAPVERWQFAVEADPETGEESVVIDIWVPQSLEEALSRDGDLTRRWVTSASPIGKGSIVILWHVA